MMTKEKWYHGHIIKFLSLTISVFMWFYVVNSEPIEVQRDFYINISSPSSYAPSSLSSKKVRLTLKGARAFLKDYRKDSLTVNIDLKSVKVKGRHRYRFKKSDFALPFGVDVVSFSPEVVRVNFDKLIKKKVPIKAVLMDNIGKDLKLVSYKIKPSKVMITGPRSVMKKTGLLKTTAIDLQHLSGKSEISLKLADLPNYISLEKEEEVKFFFDIRPKKANLTLKKIPILFVSNNSRFKTKSRYVSLEVLASEDKTIKKSEVKVYADIPDIKKGYTNIKLRATLPEDVHLLKINPSTIRVRRY